MTLYYIGLKGLISVAKNLVPLPVPVLNFFEQCQILHLVQKTVHPQGGSFYILSYPFLKMTQNLGPRL